MQDLIRCRFLQQACETAAFTLHLALLTVNQSGPAEGGWNDEWTMLEDSAECTYELDNWIGIDDTKQPIGQMACNEKDLYPINLLELLEPEDEEVSGRNTGNAGVTIDRWYKQAVVVLWPGECDKMMRVMTNSTNAAAALQKWLPQCVEVQVTNITDYTNPLGKENVHNTC